MKQMLNIALPKGRLGDKVYDMFEEAGFECPSIREKSRRLVFENREKGIKIPHLIGTITNLDKSEMNRTLVSVKSELERRQRKFRIIRLLHLI